MTESSGSAEPAGNEAHLELTNVRIRRQRSSVYVYDDRLVIESPAGRRTIPMSSLARVATRKSWRGSRLLLALDTGEVLDIRRLDASATRVAHRTVIEIARRHH